MPKIPWTRFRSEVINIYAPPCGRKTTYWKIRQILRLVEAQGVKTTADLTPGLVARFLRSGSRWRRATAKGHLSYLHVVCGHAVREGWTRSNPVEARKDWLHAWPITAAEIEEPDHLTLEQVAALLAVAEAGSSPWEGGRTYALVALVAFTGLRKTEALTRMVEDFGLERRIVRLLPNSHFQPKTAASIQPVPLAAALVPTLRTWFARCGSTWAFPARRGDVPWTSGYLGSRPLDRLKLLGREAGIPHVTWHLLRHSWATHAEHWGLGELMVQRILRHTTTRTQKGYRHADEPNLAEAVRAISFEPRAAV